MTNTLCPTCGQELPTESDTFGSRLETARVQLDMTRQALAEALGYQRTSIITRWETGQLQPTDILVVENVAKAVGVTPAWLLYGVQEPTLFENAANVDIPDEAYEEWPDDFDVSEVDSLPRRESPADIIARIRAENAPASADESV